MKIAIDIRKIGKKSTGSETYFFYLIKELAKLKRSKKHEFFLLTDKEEFEIKKILNPLPKNFKICKVAPVSKIFWTFYSLPRFLKKHSINIFHTEYIIPFHLSNKIKIISTVHDVSFRVNPKWITKKDSIVLNSLMPLSLKRTDAVITVSNFSKREIIKYYKYPAKKIFVTYPAVDDRFFSILSERKAKKETGKILGGDFPFILHISSLQPRKNVPLLILAFSLLKKEWQKNNSPWENTKLVVIGSRKGHNYDKKIDELIAKHRLEKEIKITGYQRSEKLPYFYKSALVSVFPSAYEGFGLPLVESMASGTPIVVSNIGVFQEVAGRAATYITLAKKNRTKELKKAIEELIQNKKLRRNRIKLGIERRKQFSWNKLAEKTLEVYEKI